MKIQQNTIGRLKEYIVTGDEREPIELFKSVSLASTRAGATAPCHPASAGTSGTGNGTPA